MAARDEQTPADDQATRGKAPMEAPATHQTSLTRGATSGRPFTLRYEIPTEPTDFPSALTQSAVDDISAGNHAFTLDMRETGHLGLFKDRKAVPTKVTPILMNPARIHLSISRTLQGYIRRTLRSRGTLGTAEITNRAQNIAATVADGCMLMIYMKCRNISLSEDKGAHVRSILNRPRVISDHMIPTAFAYAIQQLGVVHIADQFNGLALMPQLPTTNHNHGLPINRAWNPNAYYEAVEYCKDLGMRFSAVDLKVKKGSAWWLLRPFLEEDMFELQLPFPEVNFTDQMAAAYCLFLPEHPGAAVETLFDISAYTELFGTLVREPHHGVNLSCFEAISEIADAVWSNV